MNGAEFIKKIKGAAKIKGFLADWMLPAAKEAMPLFTSVRVSSSLKTVRKKSALVFWLRCLPTWV
jgi:hypothetical protein